MNNDEMRLSQATMVEAVQLWVDHKFAKGQAPAVLVVEKSPDGASYNDPHTFKVMVQRSVPSLIQTWVSVEGASGMITLWKQ